MRLPSLLSFSLLLTVSALADTHFADVGSVDWSAKVPPPPAPDSIAGRADLETVLQVQASRTPDQIVFAQAVAKYRVFLVFGYRDLLGPDFNPKSRPVLGALIKDLNQDLIPLFEKAKMAFARPRPFAADSRVNPCVEKPDGANTYSYPSGHSFMSYFWAAILGEVFPDKKAALYERARAIAWSRIVGGVHYPTDLEAGRRMAEAVFQFESKDPKFRAAVAACRAEVPAAAPP